MEDITYPTNQLPSSLTTDHESNIWPIFERIVATNSTKVKQEILEEYRDETLLSRILYYAYNPHLNYYLRVVMPFKDGSSNDFNNAF